VLEELMALARCTPSAANRQPLKYVLSSAGDMNARIFDTLAWAAYLAEWPGPEPSERPGGCMCANIGRVVLVIALGWPVEKVALEDCPAGGSIRYYQDAGRTHHVPKRTLAELIHARYG
jgi:hypothetical protein